MFYFGKNKQKVLELIKQKNNGELKITYKEVSNQTRYEKRQLIRFSQAIEKKDIDNLLFHGQQVEIQIIQFPTKKWNILGISRINIRLLV